MTTHDTNPEELEPTGEPVEEGAEPTEEGADGEEPEATDGSPPGAEPATGPTVKLTAEDAAPAAPPVENTEIWIVRIDGAEHQVKAGTPDNQIRETLAMTYPGARDAELTYDSVIIAGQKYKVLVFVKRAGTKGLSAARELRELLEGVGPIALAVVQEAGTFHPALRGGMVFDDLLTLPVSGEGHLVLALEEFNLCVQLASLPASPVAMVTVEGSFASAA